GWSTAGRDGQVRKGLENIWRGGGAPQMQLICHSSGTAIDELAIYPWAFTEQEVANDYSRFFPDSVERLVKLAPITVKPQYDHYRQRLEVGVRALPRGDREPDMIRLTVGTGAALIPGAVVEAALPHNGRTNVVMAVPLDFDTPYVVRAETFIEGAAVATVDDTFTRVKPEWWRNTLGKGLDVPAPWSPVTVAADGVIGVWGRTLKLAAGGLPAAITSAGAELLEGALRLHGELADGTAITLTGTAAPAMINSAPDRVQWCGKLIGGGVAADIEGELEYDGLIRLKLTLQQAGGEVQLRRLDLDVPLNAAHATQVLANGGGSNFRASWDARLVPAGEGCVWNGRAAINNKAVTTGHFLPVVWLGDDCRGLCFFGENDRGWTPNPGAAAQEIWREGGVVTYRMRLVSQPVTLESAREIELFIHPTPTKPLPEHWRAFNRGAPPVPNYEGIDAFISPTLTVPAGLPSHIGITFGLEPHSWEDVAANSEALRKRAGAPGSPRLFYIDYSWPRLGPSMAEFTRAGLFARGRMTWTAEVEDYMVWIINEYIRRDLIDGIYIDDTSLGSTTMTNSTAYRLADGTIQPGFNTMGFRRFLQRVWSLYAAQGKRARIIPHMTYCYEIPA
ncbi:MAG: hypothetical protein GX230_07675, partial [Lentisphaerae bacterium]|nr:hypothetical protein [Lentisphaerota bacterium]